jgi:hypothetical protein
MDHLQVTARFPKIDEADPAEFELVAAEMLSELLPRLMGLGGGMDIEVFGSPSPDLIEAAAGLRSTAYSYLEGRS